MGERFSCRAPAVCAAAIAIGLTNFELRAEPARNCPTLENQSVIISGTGPTAFQLNVTNLGHGSISIFQFPLGGILEQPGPTPLDFVFIPTPDFGGSTSFTYRLTPPVGCDRGTQLGKVTLAGGHSDGTAIDLNPPVDQSGLCGAVPPPLLALTLFAMFAAGRRTRL